MANLTENFSLEELCKTSTAFQNVPNDEAKGNLLLLAACILQPLRSIYGKPIYVNSGYRSAEVNKAVGGVTTSQHLRGMAADITTHSRQGNKRLFELIESLELPFDQLIDERDYQWIHVSYSSRHRRQVLHLK